MAKKSASTEKSGGAKIVEAGISIVPRGRSVVHGTMLEAGMLSQFKHDLSDVEKSDVEQLILNWLPHFSEPI